MIRTLILALCLSPLAPTSGLAQEAASTSTSEPQDLEFQIRGRVQKGCVGLLEDQSIVVIWGFFPEPDQRGGQVRLPVQSLGRTVRMRGPATGGGVREVPVFQAVGDDPELLPGEEPLRGTVPLINGFHVLGPHRWRVDMDSRVDLTGVQEFDVRGEWVLASLTFRTAGDVRPDAVALFVGRTAELALQESGPYPEGHFAAMVYVEPGYPVGEMSILHEYEPSPGNRIVAAGRFANLGDLEGQIHGVFLKDRRPVGPAFSLSGAEFENPQRPCPVTTSQVRLWTDTQGRNLKGKLTEVRHNDVIILQESGTPITIRIESLVQEDRSYIQRAREGCETFLAPPSFARESE